MNTKLYVELTTELSTKFFTKLKRKDVNQTRPTIYIDCFGSMLTIGEAANAFGLSRDTLRKRLLSKQTTKTVVLEYTTRSGYVLKKGRQAKARRLKWKVGKALLWPSNNFNHNLNLNPDHNHNHNHDHPHKPKPNPYLPTVDNDLTYAERVGTEKVKKKGKINKYLQALHREYNNPDLHHMRSPAERRANFHGNRERHNTKQKSVLCHDGLFRSLTDASNMYQIPYHTINYYVQSGLTTMKEIVDAISIRQV